MSCIRPITDWPAPQLINIQSALAIAPDLWKNVPLAALFVSNGNSYTVCTQSHTCVYIHIVCKIHGRWSGKRNKKKWDSSECRLPF